MKLGRWRLDGCYVVGGSVVGTVEKDAFDRGWWAHGCLADWQDTKLGLHDSQRKAERRVEVWVKDTS